MIKNERRGPWFLARIHVQCGGVVLSGFLLSGCIAPPPESLITPPTDTAIHQPASTVSGSPEDVSATAGTRPPSDIESSVRGDTSGDKVGQCNSELAALQKVNPRGYARYRAAIDKLIASGRQYMAVQGTISQDINDILQPRYQFGMANLCWQIRSSLSASLLESVNKIGDMDPRVSHDR